MEIREARDEDTGAVAALITHLGYATTEDEMRRRLQRIGADAQYVSLVALDHAKVVGLRYDYVSEPPLQCVRRRRAK